MLVIVDASVITHVCLAGGVLGPLGGHQLVAPLLLASEVTSAIREMAWRGEIPRHHGRDAVLYIHKLRIRLERRVDLHQRAWDIAESLGWAKTYDAEYVALAMIHRAPLVTVDGRLLRGAGHLVSILAPHELRRGAGA